jgi:SAM-dependent methyltransferase
MSGANEFEHRRWNDDYWLSVWPKRERLTDEVTGYLLGAASLEPGERVLDIGYGGGRTSLAAARAVGPEGAVIGADISEPLSRLARGRAEEAGLENVEFRVADMQTDRLEGGPFDAAISQFGVMFFDEPAAAFRNVRAHLRPGGRFVFACWQSTDRNPWFFGPAIAEFVPPPSAPEPGKSATGPFALADPERTVSILEAAGFANVDRRPYELEVEVPEDTVVDEVHLAFVGVPGEKLQAAKIAVDAQLGGFKLPSGLSRFPLAFQIFHATDPTPVWTPK